MNTRVSDGVHTREIAGRALAILDAGGALYKTAALSMAPRPTPELDAVLAEFGRTPPTVAVRCDNFQRCGGKRITKWVYDPEWKGVIPAKGETAAWTHGATPWLERANAEKGPIQTADGRAATHDGLGTHHYTCPVCHRRRSLSAEYRLHLYLTALAQGRKTTSI